MNDSINTETNLNDTLNLLISQINIRYDFKKFHFVEIFIFFFDYFSLIEKEYSLDKESFVLVNSSLFSLLRRNSFLLSDEEELEKHISNDLFKILNNDENYDKSIILENLILYFKQISITELNQENIFKIFDKNDKEIVSEEEVEELLSAITGFIEDNCNNDFSLENKKENLIKKLFKGNHKNIDESCIRRTFIQDESILEEILIFFNQAEEIILNKFELEKINNNNMCVINLLKNEEINYDEEDEEGNYYNNDEEEENLEISDNKISNKNSNRNSFDFDKNNENEDNDLMYLTPENKRQINSTRKSNDNNIRNSLFESSDQYNLNNIQNSSQESKKFISNNNIESISKIIPISYNSKLDYENIHENVNKFNQNLNENNLIENNNFMNILCDDIKLEKIEKLRIESCKLFILFNKFRFI